MRLAIVPAQPRGAEESVVRAGRPPAARFLRDWAPFALLLVAYELLRDASAWLAVPRHDLSGLERSLMAGHEPTVLLQAVFYRPSVVGWQDVLGTAVYFLHFVVPAAVGLVFWLGDRARFHRFVASLVAVCGLAFATYLVAPTTPPWLAAPGLIHHVIDETLAKLQVPTSILWAYSHRDYNLYAAFPSLHAAFPLVATIHAWGYRRWLGPMMGGWTLLVWAMVVYLGEHLVLDVAGGIVFAIGATWAVSVLGRRLTNHLPRSEVTVAAAQARRPRPRGLAVVMSGGAALGAFQAGVIDVLARRAVGPDRRHQHRGHQRRLLGIQSGRRRWPAVTRSLAAGRRLEAAPAAAARDPAPGHGPGVPRR